MQFLTGKSFKNPSTCSGLITNWPSGLFQSLAIFARNLLGAIPAEIVMPTFLNALPNVSSN